MRKKLCIRSSSLAVGFLLLMLATRALAQATSTPEERVRWAEISHKLEANPLDEGVNKEGETRWTGHVRGYVVSPHGSRTSAKERAGDDLIPLNFRWPLKNAHRTHFVVPMRQR